MFAMGHENGAISFWSLKEEDKPIMVRTLDDIDIDRPVLPETLPKSSAGPREPIFKLTWSAFPEQGWYEYGAQAAGAWTSSAGSSQNDKTASAGGGNGNGLSLIHI